MFKVFQMDMDQSGQTSQKAQTKIKIKRIDLKSFWKRLTSSPKNIILFIFGVFAVVVLLYFIVFTIVQYRAEAKIAREEIVAITLSNVTNGTATISWQTFKPQVGIVFYGTKNDFLPFYPAISKNVEYDDRDTEFVDLNTEVLKTDEPQRRYTHHVTIEGLTPETTYYFRIGSGFVMPVAKGSDGKGFTAFTTGSTLNALYAPDPVYGKVLDEEGKPLDEGIIYLSIYNKDEDFSALLSTIMNETGGYSLDIANARYAYIEQAGKTTEDVFTSSDAVVEIIRVVAGSDYVPKTFTILPDQDQPVGDVILPNSDKNK